MGAAAIFWMGVMLSAGDVGSEVDTQLAHNRLTNTKVYARVGEGRVKFRSRGIPDEVVGYLIDVDGDGRIDPRVDRAYGSRPDGSPCAMAWMGESQYGRCGDVASRASATEQMFDGDAVRWVTVPIEELTRNGRTVRIGLVMSRTGQPDVFAWLQYDVVTGEARTLPPWGQEGGAPTGARPTASSAPEGVAGSATARSLDSRQLTARRDAGKEFVTRVCSFDFLPNVQLLWDEMEGHRGRFKAKPRESATPKNNELVLTLLPSGEWDGSVLVSDARFIPLRVRSASFEIDGQAYRLTPTHLFERKVDERDNYRDYVSVRELPQPVLDAMSRATTAQLVLKNEAGETSRWTFDVADLRYLRPAMEASQWTCNGAW